MGIDFNKPVRTRHGHHVRILCTDAGGRYPVIGLRTNPNDSRGELLEQWTEDGSYVHDDDKPHCLDLVNVAAPRARAHAELIAKWAQDRSMRIKHRSRSRIRPEGWRETEYPLWFPESEYAEILPGDPLY